MTGTRVFIVTNGVALAILARVQYDYVSRLTGDEFRSIVTPKREKNRPLNTHPRSPRKGRNR